jgi:anthranilate phosphoribosyltransferase
VSEILKYIKKVTDNQSLSIDEAARAFQIITHGGGTPAQIAALIVALKIKGEREEEIIGMAHAIRMKSVKIKTPFNAIDPYTNVSLEENPYHIALATSFVLAGCGVPVVKYSCNASNPFLGSSYVLSLLGVNLETDISIAEQCLERANLAFLMGPKFHYATRDLNFITSELEINTILNLIDPLCNPATLHYQLIGGNSQDTFSTIVKVLQHLNYKRSWLVCGEDGLDALTLAGRTYITEVYEGKVSHFEITPEQAQLDRNNLEKIEIGDTHSSTQQILDLLNGIQNPYKDLIILNTAAALVLTGHVEDLMAGAILARKSIDEGRAHLALKNLVEITNQ